jgi:hypothetical protein
MIRKAMLSSLIICTALLGSFNASAVVAVQAPRICRLVYGAAH